MGSTSGKGNVMSIMWFSWGLIIPFVITIFFGVGLVIVFLG